MVIFRAKTRFMIPNAINKLNEQLLTEIETAASYVSEVSCPFGASASCANGHPNASVGSHAYLAGGDVRRAPRHNSYGSRGTRQDYECLTSNASRRCVETI